MWSGGKRENTMPHVCPWQHVRSLDNFLRPFFHNPKKLFGKYVKPGMKVMDVGCGAGFASIGMAHMVGEKGRVHAVDLQPEMLDMVKVRAEKAMVADRVHTHKCSENDLGLEDCFDFVNAFYMVHEVPDMVKFLTQVRSMLHDDGFFYIVEPPFHVTKKEFSNMVEQAVSIGFKEYERPKMILSRAVVFAAG